MQLTPLIFMTMTDDEKFLEVEEDIRLSNKIMHYVIIGFMIGITIVLCSILLSV